MTDQPIYEDRADYLKAVAAPEYAQSARYRDEVATKLQASMAAGTVTPMGQFVGQHRDAINGRMMTPQRPEALYSPGTNPMPTADPIWAEAGKVGSVAFFENPEQIANAMAAPHFEIDAGYREAVREKIERSIRESYITPDFQPIDPSKRFSR